MNSLLRISKKTIAHISSLNYRMSWSIPHFGWYRMSTNVVPLQNRNAFQDTLPYIINSVVTNPQLKDVPEVSRWIKKMLEYNLVGGKMLRGFMTVFAYEMIENPKNVTEESMKQAHILGWCVEMFQTYFILADDLMDGSSIRRDKLCWHMRSDVGMSAVNDICIINSSICYILKKYFSSMPQYNHILDLFNEINLHTAAGQLLDHILGNQNLKDYSMFTMDQYTSLTKYKACYTFKLPICQGLLLANMTDNETHEKCEDICTEMGKLYQIQDDYIDCFGEETESGSDIQTGKCTWLAVMALQRCNDTQLKIFEENYGIEGTAHSERIKRLYLELELPKIYSQHKRDCYNNILNKVHDLSRDIKLPPTLFIKLLDMIIGRDK